MPRRYLAGHGEENKQGQRRQQCLIVLVIEQTCGRAKLSPRWYPCATRQRGCLESQRPTTSTPFTATNRVSKKRERKKEKIFNEFVFSPAGERKKEMKIEGSEVLKKEMEIEGSEVLKNVWARKPSNLIEHVRVGVHVDEVDVALGVNSAGWVRASR